MTFFEMQVVIAYNYLRNMNPYGGMGGHMPISIMAYEAFLRMVKCNAFEGVSKSILMPNIIGVFIQIDNEFLTIEHEKEEQRRKADEKKSSTKSPRNRSGRR